MNLSKLHNKYFYIIIWISYFSFNLLVDYWFDVYTISRSLIQSTIGSTILVIVLYLIFKYDIKKKTKEEKQ